LRAYQRVIAPR